VYVFYVVLVIATELSLSIGGYFLYYLILLAVLTALLFFIQFRITIGEGYLSYQILFFEKPIYKKVLYPYQIIKMKFKRIGWTTKCSIIQVKNGFNIRVVNFAPNTVFIDLIEFANENSVSIIKTKDYLILER
jgi:hypothetical protein